MSVGSEDWFATKLFNSLKNALEDVKNLHLDDKPIETGARVSSI
jgi:hypothetical protein